jgi:hypothetical protein
VDVKQTAWLESEPIEMMRRLPCERSDESELGCSRRPCEGGKLASAVSFVKREARAGRKVSDRRTHDTLHEERVS